MSFEAGVEATILPWVFLMLNAYVISDASPPAASACAHAPTRLIPSVRPPAMPNARGAHKASATRARAYIFDTSHRYQRIFKDMNCNPVTEVAEWLIPLLSFPLALGLVAIFSVLERASRDVATRMRVE